MEIILGVYFTIGMILAVMLTIILVILDMAGEISPTVIDIVFGFIICAIWWPYFLYMAIKILYNTFRTRRK